MRLFIFGIGGTGARVLNALIMQLATGAKMVDPDGRPLTSVIPILIDPHATNEGLKQASVLLASYRAIHQRLYGNEAKKQTGFFSTKVQTLKDINPNGVKADDFFFRLNKVSDSRFQDFIDLNNLNGESKQMAQILFSDEELKTNMREGFYGSPNIGCVALREFVESEDFRALCSVFAPGDKIFFAGSIFGGTGAAGLPLMINSIRSLKDSTEGNTQVCAQAPIGALIVTPYFDIASDEDSPINSSEFITKTKSALKYYAQNLNKRINNIYYIGAPEKTTPFENDPGNKSNQSGNKAHFVEFAGAEAIFDFAKSSNTDVYDGVVGSPSFKAYYKRDDLALNLSNLPAPSKERFRSGIMGLFLSKFFLDRDFNGALDKPFAIKHNPRIMATSYKEDLAKFLTNMAQWAKEMESHGSTAHQLSLYNIPVEKDYSHVFPGIKTKRRTLGVGNKKLEPGDIIKKLNDVANENEKRQINFDTEEQRLLAQLYEAMEQIIGEFYELN